MTAPNEHKVKNNTSCLTKCLVKKSISSNANTLFDRKFVVTETIIPANVACRYQTFDTTFARRYETT